MTNKVLLEWGYMFYEEMEGNDTNIVFIHGAGNRGRVWQRVMEGLEGFRCLAVDLPGHGNSSCKYEEGIDGYAERVEEFIRALELGNTILVGHSMGGAITIKLASRMEEVKGAVLVGTGATLWVNPKLLNGLRDNFLNAVETMVRWSFKKGTGEDLLSPAREMMRKTGREVLYRDMYACSIYSGVENLRNIKVPTLVVCGSTDVMTPLDFSEELKNGIENSELLVIPDAGHMVHVEKPEELARGIKSFIERKIKAQT